MNKVKIVIADDHALFREGMALLINAMQDFALTNQAKDGQELLDLLGALEGTNDFPEICLLDINMPIMNGYEAMKLLNAKYPFLPVLALSMIDSDFSIKSMISDGAKGFLHKNCNRDELLDALECLIKGEYYFSKSLPHVSITVRRNPVPGLTDRELEFISYCPLNLSYKEIGEKMAVSERTVHWYRDSLFNKLNIKKINELIAFAFKTGIISG